MFNLILNQTTNQPIAATHLLELHWLLYSLVGSSFSLNFIGFVVASSTDAACLFKTCMRGSFVSSISLAFLEDLSWASLQNH